MSVTVTKGEGVTVITLNSKEGSAVPLLCQILGTLCYTPACSLSQTLRKVQSSSQLILGTIQIMVGILIIGLGAGLVSIGSWTIIVWTKTPFWLGGMIIASGIMCILASKFPSPCLVGINVFLNLVVAALAITGVVMYAIDVTYDHFTWICHDNIWYDNYYWRQTTPVPSTDVQEMKKRLLEQCETAKAKAQMLFIAFDVVLIVLAVLQLFVNISSVVLGLKALCKIGKEKNIQDLEQYKPLLEEVTTNPAV
ncbi:transmembrane protein 176B [Esox lucius]|uniref:Transmembrane protein 176l.2 n=1 Tax=Esox lucius TaxID=8010 RepID=A0A3P8Y752_ESOLU|nr:transmembrane protein 176B [Esox lucius]